MERLRFEIDDCGTIGITLMEFKTLREMDEFMKQFHDSNDVRRYFFDKINTFLKTKEAKRFFDNPAKDGRERNGYIICYHEYDYHKMRRISCLYDNEITSDSLYTKLREALYDPKVLKEIYDRKYFLLPSAFSKDELRRAVVNHRSPKAFVDDFVRYIHNLDPERQYIYFRSLCDICNLLSFPKQTTAITVKVIVERNIEGITEYSLHDMGEFHYDVSMEDEPMEEFEYCAYSWAPQHFIDVFYEAIRTEDYDRLFNEFTQEEIDLYSNFYRKGRGK